MPTPLSSRDRIAALQAEIVQLQKSAIAEFQQRREDLVREIAKIDGELAQLTGKPQEKKPRARREIPAAKLISLQELKDLLAAVPGKSLGVRQAGLSLPDIKVLAAVNPQLLRMGGKGPWPTVELLK